jgi:hypothetical protein
VRDERNISSPIPLYQTRVVSSLPFPHTSAFYLQTTILHSGAEGIRTPALRRAKAAR